MSILSAFISACATNKLPTIPTAPKVELQKFMGDWYVIAAIPTFIEKESFNAIESYSLAEDRSIKTTFTFNKGSLTGQKKVYNPRGFVVENSGNALWGMQFIWPIKAQYKIAYVNADYSQTIIARDARDYVWIMARSPHISEDEYAFLENFVVKLGYSKTLLRKVPHNP